MTRSGQGWRGGGFAANELVNGLDRVSLLVRAQFRVHGQGQNLAGHCFRHRERARAGRAETLIGLSEVQGSGVMNAGGNTPLGEKVN